MKKEELYRLLENGPVYLDGATGSNLQKAGMPTGVCPEDVYKRQVLCPRYIYALQSGFCR